MTFSSGHHDKKREDKLGTGEVGNQFPPDLFLREGFKRVLCRMYTQRVQ